MSSQMIPPQRSEQKQNWMAIHSSYVIRVRRPRLPRYPVALGENETTAVVTRVISGCSHITTGKKAMWRSRLHKLPWL